MSIETELKDELVYEKEITSMMKLSEKSLEFLKEEPDIYSIRDLVIGEFGETGDILKQGINEKLEKIFRFK